jgi:O-antigen/teichoic acid export membrane protein
VTATLEPLNDHVPSAPPDEAAAFGRSVARTALSSLINVFVGLVGAVLISRRFGSEIFGKFVSVAIPVALLALISTTQEQVGFMQVSAPFAHHQRRFVMLAKAIYRYSATLTAAATVVVGAVTWWFLGGPADAPELRGPALTLLVGYATLGNLGWNLDGVLTAQRASAKLAVARTSDAIVQPALALGASLVTRSVWAFVIAMWGMWVVGTVIRIRAVQPFVAGWWSVRTIDASWDAQRARTIGFRLLPGVLAAGVVDQTSPWIIRGVLGNTPSANRTLGAYGRAANLTGRLTELNYRVNALLLPSLSDRFEHGDEVGYRDVVRTAVVKFLAPVGALCLVGVVAAPLALRIFGDDFVEATTPLRLLIVAAYLNTVDIVALMVLVSRGHERLPARTTMLGAAVVLSTIVPLTATWGASGAAAAVVAGQAASTAWRLPLVRTTLPHGLRSIVR